VKPSSKQLLELELQPAHATQLFEKQRRPGHTLHLFAGPEHCDALHPHRYEHRSPTAKLFDRPHFDGHLEGAITPSNEFGTNSLQRATTTDTQDA